MIQHGANRLSHSKSFKVVQIFKRCKNHLRSHKLCKEAKNHSALDKSFKVIQNIQRNTNYSP